MEKSSDTSLDFAILPWVNVVKIGGQSIMDRGRKAVYPLVAKIVANFDKYLEAPFVDQLLPAMLAAERGAVFNGIPPYALWEHPPAVGKLPPHGSDAGSYLVGEFYGAQRYLRQRY